MKHVHLFNNFDTILHLIFTMLFNPTTPNVPGIQWIDTGSENAPSPTQPSVIDIWNDGDVL